MSKPSSLKSDPHDYSKQSTQKQTSQENLNCIPQNGMAEVPKKKKLKIRKKILFPTPHVEALISSKRQVILAKKFDQISSPANPIPGTLYADFMLESLPKQHAGQFLNLEQNILLSDTLPDYGFRPMTTGSIKSQTGNNNMSIGPRYDNQNKIIPRSIVGDPKTYNKKFQEFQKEMIVRENTQKKNEKAEKPTKRTMLWITSQVMKSPKKHNNVIINEKLQKLKQAQEKEKKKQEKYLRTLPTSVQITEKSQEKKLQNFFETNRY